MKYIITILLAILVLPLFTQADTLTNLVNYWTFDSNWISGTKAYSAFGSRNTGTTAGSPTATKGKVGQALAFNGSSQTVSSAIDLSGTAQVTVAFWMKWTTFANTDNLAMEFGSAGTYGGNGILIDPNSGSTGNDFLIDNGGASPNFDNGGHFPRPSAGVWHHYVLTFDRSLGTALQTGAYVDGVPQTVTQIFSSTVNGGNFANGTIYMMSRTGTTLWGAGSLDDVRIYSRILTASDAKQLYLSSWYGGNNY